MSLGRAHLLIIVCAVSCSAATEESLNSWIDAILDNVRAESTLLGWGKLSLPGITTLVNKTSWYEIYENVTLTNGYIEGVENLYRYDNASITYSDLSLTATVPILFKELKVQYDFNAPTKVWLLSLSGELKGTISRLKAYVVLNCNLNTMEVQAEEISFPSTGTINLYIDSSFIWDLIVNPWLKVIVTIFKPLIIKDVQKILLKDVNRLLSNISK